MKSMYGVIPKAVVSDGCYASQDSAKEARELGVKQIVFSKPVGLSYHEMGVKKKTAESLKNSGQVLKAISLN